MPEELNFLFYLILIYLNLRLVIEAVLNIFLLNMTLLFWEDCFTLAVALYKILLLNPSEHLYFTFQCGYYKILNYVVPYIIISLDTAIQTPWIGLGLTMCLQSTHITPILTVTGF